MSAQFRDPVNVPDLLERDRLVRRIRVVRENAESNKTDIQHWNRAHPDEEPFGTEFEDGIIAWCDGLGPLPALPPEGEP